MEKLIFGYEKFKDDGDPIDNCIEYDFNGWKICDCGNVFLGMLQRVKHDYLIKSKREWENLLVNTKKFLSKISEEKIIITDYQFFSSLLNNQFASPNKWYDDLSIPKKGSNYYKIHKDFFLKKIESNKIKYMYFIGNEKHTMNFFNELASKNKCIVSKNINEILTEFNLNQCDKIL